jgi:hypothetical protein
MTLRDLALQQLSKATVRIEGPSPYPGYGDKWNVNELAIFKVTVINTTGLPLRDVLVLLRADDPAQVIYSYSSYYLGFWASSKLEPNASAVFYGVVYARRAGNAHIYAHIVGETVPYVANPCIAELAPIAVTPQ